MTSFIENKSTIAEVEQSTEEPMEKAEQVERAGSRKEQQDVANLPGDHHL